MTKLSITSTRFCKSGGPPVLLLRLDHFWSIYTKMLLIYWQKNRLRKFFHHSFYWANWNPKFIVKYIQLLLILIKDKRRHIHLLNILIKRDRPMDVHFLEQFLVFDIHLVTLRGIKHCIQFITRELWHHSITIFQSCNYLSRFKFPLVDNCASLPHIFLHNYERFLSGSWIFYFLAAICQVYQGIFNRIAICIMFVAIPKEITFILSFPLAVYFSLSIRLEKIGYESLRNKLSDIALQVEIDKDGCLFCDISLHSEQIKRCVT